MLILKNLVTPVYVFFWWIADDKIYKIFQELQDMKNTPSEPSPKRLPRRINRRDQRRYTIRWNTFDWLIAITILRLNRAPIFYEHHAKDVRRHALHRIV